VRPVQEVFIPPDSYSNDSRGNSLCFLSEAKHFSGFKIKGLGFVTTMYRATVCEEMVIGARAWADHLALRWRRYSLYHTWCSAYTG
jgi:hypothetical protein